jgi:hypothetical protein
LKSAWVAARHSVLPLSKVSKALLGRNLGGQLQFVRVGREVNQPKFKGAGCIRPVDRCKLGQPTSLRDREDYQGHCSCLLISQGPGRRVHHWRLLLRRLDRH